jgi:hypothetical protein
VSNSGHPFSPGLRHHLYGVRTYGADDYVAESMSGADRTTTQKVE